MFIESVVSRSLIIFHSVILCINKRVNINRYRSYVKISISRCQDSFLDRSR